MKLHDDSALSAMFSIVLVREVTRFGGIQLLAGKLPSPHHAKDMAEGALRAILGEAGIDVNDFLRA